MRSFLLNDYNLKGYNLVNEKLGGIYEKPVIFR